MPFPVGDRINRQFSKQQSESPLGIQIDNGPRLDGVWRPAGTRADGEGQDDILTLGFQQADDQIGVFGAASDHLNPRQTGLICTSYPKNGRN